MKILLLAPSACQTLRSVYPEHLDGETGIYPPLGLLYLAAAVNSTDRHTACVLDMTLVADPETLTATIDREEPDLVGITALTFNAPAVRDLATNIKTTHPGMPIVLGGPHAHIYPTETLSWDAVDYVLTGEGEKALPLFLDALSGTGLLVDIPGLHTEQNGEKLANAHRPLQDLGELPQPDRSLLPVEAYRALMLGGSCHTILISSRGCPFRCTYCDRPQMGKNYRARPAPHVLHEIEDCLRHDIDGIAFFDDTLTLQRDRVVTICEGILQARWRFVWSARTRVDTVDAALLRLMRRAGCRHISFGVESGSQAVLEAIQKGITLEQVRTSVAAARSAGMTVMADFMLGNPGETPADMGKTIDLACSLPIHYAQFSITTPYPATPLYEQYRQKRPELGDYWREFACHPRADFRPPTWAEPELSPDELALIWRQALRRFYLRPGPILREVARFSTWQRLPMKARLALKMLFGK